MVSKDVSGQARGRVLRIRWLGRVPYPEALALQRALHRSGEQNYVLLVEHPHVFTLGLRGDRRHLLVDPVVVGAELAQADRGGDVTYHGPGQLVVYPIVNVAMGPGAIPAYVRAVEQLAIDLLEKLGLHVGRLAGFPGVWVEPDGPNPRKICAVGVRVSHSRSMHGLALNVNPDLEWFERIVPCGIADKAVTSLAAEGLSVSMRQAVDAMVQTLSQSSTFGSEVEFQSVSWPGLGAKSAHDSEPAKDLGLRNDPDFWHGSAGASKSNGGSDGPDGRIPGERAKIRLRQAGVDPDSLLPLRSPKPHWLRVPARMGTAFFDLKRTMRTLDLVTVCEEAGCPNIFECWAEGTATFMINGERCTRACGFCLVDTRHPLPVDPGEPGRVAEAVERLGLEHVVVTAVARDDLDDGGADAFATTIDAIRRRSPGTAVEVLVPDLKGNAESLARIFDARPDVLNHNLETVARLQRAVRPSAGYARSLAVLARAKESGLVSKSGLMLGLGETEGEVIGALADLRAAGVDIVTIGQYLRPSAAHLPVARWWTPDEFDRIRDSAAAMGFAHVQASPLTRSSYHARAATAAATSTSGSKPVTVGSSLATRKARTREPTPQHPVR
ncbi:MAG TPA: lipoyl synthase [Acidimicrobiales bacterium]|nr:lipoyl synthase [Acidimicrobiales bacterium]